MSLPQQIHWPYLDTFLQRVKQVRGQNLGGSRQILTSLQLLWNPFRFELLMMLTVFLTIGLLLFVMYTTKMTLDKVNVNMAQECCAAVKCWVNAIRPTSHIYHENTHLYCSAFSSTFAHTFISFIFTRWALIFIHFWRKYVWQTSLSVAAVVDLQMAITFSCSWSLLQNIPPWVLPFIKYATVKSLLKQFEKQIRRNVFLNHKHEDLLICKVSVIKQ